MSNSALNNVPSAGRCVVIPMLTHWRFCSLAPSRRFVVTPTTMFGIETRDLHLFWNGNFYIVKAVSLNRDDKLNLKCQTLVCDWRHIWYVKQYIIWILIVLGIIYKQVNWWVQERRNCIAKALQLRLSCTYPSKLRFVLCVVEVIMLVNSCGIFAQMISLKIFTSALLFPGPPGSPLEISIKYTCTQSQQNIKVKPTPVLLWKLYCHHIIRIEFPTTVIATLVSQYWPLSNSILCNPLHHADKPMPRGYNVIFSRHLMSPESWSS